MGPELPGACVLAGASFPRRPRDTASFDIARTKIEEAIHGEEALQGKRRMPAVCLW